MSEISSQLDAARDRLRAEAEASRYLTVSEAAELARCSERTVRRAFEKGALRAFRPASRVLLREDDVRAWVEGAAAVKAPRPRPQGTRARSRRSPGSVQALREIEGRLSR